MPLVIKIIIADRQITGGYEHFEYVYNSKFHINSPNGFMVLFRKNNSPKATLHSFRQTFNQKLRDLGLGIEDRQALLAHAASSTTKIYTLPNLNLAREYVNKLPVFDSMESNVTPALHNWAPKAAFNYIGLQKEKPSPVIDK